MYSFSTYSFDKQGLNELKKKDPFPSVYIIENGSEIYIGEAVDPAKRIQSHISKTIVSQPANMHIISNEDFNKSVILDLESYLIQLVKSEGKLSMINKNELGVRHNYFMRQSYQNRFPEIWRKLIELGLSEKHEELIKNSQIFDFSPYKSLFQEQEIIVDEILDLIENNEKNVFVIYGEAGSGKTIVANYLLKALYEKNKDVALVFSMTSIRKTIKDVFKKVLGMEERIIGPADLRHKRYEILIVDETHRLNRRKNLANYGVFDSVNKHFGLDNDGDQFDWVIKSADTVILFFDANQSIKPSDILSKKVKQFIDGSNSIEFTLENQIRVNGGKNYLDMINAILYEKEVKKFRIKNYDFKLFDNIHEMYSAIQNQETVHGFSRLIAGYDWAWDKNSEFDIEINGLKLKWNSKTEDWISSPNSINEVGSIHTTQGYTLNYAGVIIGPSLGYDKNKNQIVAFPDLYKDRNGKAGIEPKQLKEFILNIYYVLLTRARLGTYIFIEDINLREYFKNQIPEIINTNSLER